MNNNELDVYINALLDKSKEAFFMSLEIINKPTIKYRTEGFSFFICNAWELLLKAWIVKSKNDIKAMYYNDKRGKKGKKRSLSLHDCLQKYRTRENDPLRVNVSFIADIRNTATHDIIPELDFKLSASFQSCIEYYSSALLQEFGISLSESGVENFISLAAVPDIKIEPTFFINKDTEDIIDSIMSNKEEKGIVEQNLTIVRARLGSNEDLSFRIAKEGEVPVHVITEGKDINALYPLTNRQVIAKSRQLLASGYTEPHFTTHTFLQFRKHHKIDKNPEYCYSVENGQSYTYKYSSKLPMFISTTLINDQKFYNSILPKSMKAQKKEEVPGEVISR